MADENKTKRSDTQLDSRKQFFSVLEESDNYTQRSLKPTKSAKQIQQNVENINKIHVLNASVRN